MAYIITYVANQILDRLESRDTRLDHLPFTSPMSLIIILGSYIFFVRKIGPSIMSKRKPFSLHKVMMIYDLIQIVLNASLFFYAIYSWCVINPNFNFACQRIDYGKERLPILEAESVYYFYCLKLLDLLDTVFFILRKKSRQVSFLHVYHHVIALFGTYTILGWSAGGQFLIIGLFNSFIHIFVYLYYFAIAYKPELKSNIGIKITMTKLQMIQFAYLCYFFGRPLLLPGCAIPKVLLFEAFFQNVVLLFLFSNFYYRNYLKN